MLLVESSKLSINLIYGNHVWATSPHILAVFPIRVTVTLHQIRKVHVHQRSRHFMFRVVIVPAEQYKIPIVRTENHVEPFHLRTIKRHAENFPVLNWNPNSRERRRVVIVNVTPHAPELSNLFNVRRCTSTHTVVLKIRAEGKQQTFASVVEPIRSVKSAIRCTVDWTIDIGQRERAIS